MSREYIIKRLEEIIYEVMDRVEARQYKGTPGKNPHSIRVSYINSLSGLVKAYSTLLKDEQVDELMKEVNELKEEVKEWVI